MARTSSPSGQMTESGLGAPRSGDIDPTEVSRYVADLCGELSKMTRSAKLLMLSYLLAMARQEAERIARDAAAAK